MRNMASDGVPVSAVTTGLTPFSVALGDMFVIFRVWFLRLSMCVRVRFAKIAAGIVDASLKLQRQSVSKTS